MTFEAAVARWRQSARDYCKGDDAKATAYLETCRMLARKMGRGDYVAELDAAIGNVVTITPQPAEARLDDEWREQEDA